MNIRKTISLSFLLFVNMLVLAHSVVPHHYHNEQAGVCFVDTDCCSHEEEEPNREQTTPFHHEYELGHCCIDNSYIRTNSDVKVTCHIDKTCHCEHAYAFISNHFTLPDFDNSIIVYFRQKPDVPLFYSEFIAQSIGLRAPPVC